MFLPLKIYQDFEMRRGKYAFSFLKKLFSRNAMNSIKLVNFEKLSVVLKRNDKGYISVFYVLLN